MLYTLQIIYFEIQFFFWHKRQQYQGFSGEDEDLKLFRATKKCQSRQNEDAKAASTRIEHTTRPVITLVGTSVKP